jgi:hypothetical protein
LRAFCYELEPLLIALRHGEPLRILERHGGERGEMTERWDTVGAVLRGRHQEYQLTHQTTCAACDGNGVYDLPRAHRARVDCADASENRRVLRRPLELHWLTLLGHAAMNREGSGQRGARQRGRLAGEPNVYPLLPGSGRSGVRSQNEARAAQLAALVARLYQNVRRVRKGDEPGRAPEQSAEC